MPFQITPSLGIELEYVGGLPYYDAGRPTASPQLGAKVIGNDGHEYVWTVASANVAAATAVIITEPGMTIAGGAGPYSTQTGRAVLSGQYSWVRSNAQ
jgi:hypothetical protein